jgi:hypothetical protein
VLLESLDGDGTQDFVEEHGGAGKPSWKRFLEAGHPVMKLERSTSVTDMHRIGDLGERPRLSLVKLLVTLTIIK